MRIEKCLLLSTLALQAACIYCGGISFGLLRFCDSSGTSPLYLGTWQA